MSEYSLLGLVDPALPNVPLPFGERQLLVPSNYLFLARGGLSPSSFLSEGILPIHSESFDLHRRKPAGVELSWVEMSVPSIWWPSPPPARSKERC